jgi:hypothetical protein
MRQHHAINLPRAERPEGSRKLEPVFHPNLLLAQTVGTLHNISLNAKFIETMRVFDEFCRNASNLLNFIFRVQSIKPD